MKYATATVLVAAFGLTSAAPAHLRREVPQEKSHNKFLASVRTSLALNNPAGIVDPVFGLLGNAAAAKGAGTITNLDCLHQATADQAFTNAKAAKDVQGQTDALIYAALERNTGAVGLKSVLCNETAVNPEVAAITQHQDPASDGAAATNKAIVLALAQQIAAIGGNPLDALQSGTFAPGKLGDPTAAGNTCDTEDCIFTENKLVNDATEAEINAAVAGKGAKAGGAAAGGAAAGGAAAGGAAATTPASQATSAAASACSAAVTATTTVDAAGAGGAAQATPSAPASNANSGASSAGSAASGSAASGSAAGTNVQTFTGSLGGTAPPVLKSSGTRPFSVNGNTFVNSGAALQRSCAIQNNACANAVNSGQLASKSVSDCGAQEQACNAAASAGAAKRAALNFGSCSNPAVKFAVGLDGRKEASFQAANQADFPHGSALNIKVIAEFICQQLSSKCKADAATIAACNAGETAAAAATGQASADAFNKALGV